MSRNLFLTILLVFFFLPETVLFLLLRVFVFASGTKSCGAKTSGRFFQDMVWIQFIRLIFSLICEVTAFVRAFVWMQIPYRSLPLSVIRLLLIFTFEFPSDTSANMLHVSALLILEFMKLLVHKMLSNTCFCILFSVLDNI